VIARNQDDHTKNISFLMDKTGTWSLAPAYDVTYAYNPTNKWISRHQMAVNGKRENITSEDLISVAKQMNIKKPKEIIDKVKDVVNNWAQYAKEADVPKNQIDALGKTHLTQI
jgi:serine/threonine-protein kinase HipA